MVTGSKIHVTGVRDTVTLQVSENFLAVAVEFGHEFVDLAWDTAIWKSAKLRVSRSPLTRTVALPKYSMAVYTKGLEWLFSMFYFFRVTRGQ